MTPAIAHALAAAAAFANAGSALVILYFMQAVTYGAGIRCRLALLQLVQRISYGILAMLLMKNALDIYASGEPPTWQHLGVQFSFFLCCTVSYLRHRLSPPIPPRGKNPLRRCAMGHMRRNQTVQFTTPTESRREP